MSPQVLWNGLGSAPRLASPDAYTPTRSDYILALSQGPSSVASRPAMYLLRAVPLPFLSTQQCWLYSHWFVEGEGFEPSLTGVRAHLSLRHSANLPICLNVFRSIFLFENQRTSRRADVALWKTKFTLIKPRSASKKILTTYMSIPIYYRSFNSLILPSSTISKIFVIAFSWIIIISCKIIIE